MIFMCPVIFSQELGFCLFRSHAKFATKQLQNNQTMKNSLLALTGIFLGLHCGQNNSLAWDYEGHRAVNEVALKSLPANFPAFVKTRAARERIAFLAGEPDRWRNTQDHTLRHFNEPDHYLDMERLADFGLKPETVSPFRYEFVSQLAAVRVKNPNLEPVVDS